MPGRQPSLRRSPEYAWLITGPMALVSVILATALVIEDPRWIGDWPTVVLLFLLLVVTNVGVLHLVIRRQGFSVTVNEIPLVLAYYFLPPITVILIATLASLLTQVRRRVAPAKLWFNVAKTATAISAACMVLTALPPMRGVGPSTWGTLFVAASTSNLVTLAAVVGVISLVQGPAAGRETARAATPTLVAGAINVSIALLFLIALVRTGWSAMLIVSVLVGALVLVYRSYSEFFRQHRTLADVYELTRSLTDSGIDGTLIDSLLVRVRALVQAEYATIWLPALGRHPEVLLTCRMDDSGLLDISPTPLPVREKAVAQARTVAVGTRLTGHEELRPVLRDSGVKDVIAIPLRSGQAVIGSLELVNRLGDLNHFLPADVQVLETVAAHAAVAVENSRLVDRLRFDAYHDGLTSLPNRRRVTEALEASVNAGAPDEVVAVLLFDIDGLRDVNESLGHAAGDRLVVEVSRRLREFAPPAALVGRVGGDEFVVTLRAASTEAAVELATDLREQTRTPMVFGTLTLEVNTAVGVAVHPDHGVEPATLLQRADLAATAAKALPHGIQLFNAALESRAVRRLGLSGDLRRALDRGDIQVHYQPKVSLEDRRMVGVECLARWDHPTHGAVAPEDFVAVAEHTGQLGKLTEVVLREGLRRCRDWADPEHPLCIGVNLSARTLLDPNFPALVQFLLKEYGVKPGRLTLEIAESGVAEEVERVLPTLRRLRNVGVRLSVDDFGTGASSLSHLRRLPIHEVKIDCSFVQGMATDAGDQAIVRAVIGLSREFGLSVVAEAVESELTLELLKEMGCQVGQGFLFSRPLPYERLVAWFGASSDAEPGAASESRPGEVPPGEVRPGEVRRLRAVP